MTGKDRTKQKKKYTKLTKLFFNNLELKMWRGTLAEKILHRSSVKFAKLVHNPASAQSNFTETVSV